MPQKSQLTTGSKFKILEDSEESHSKFFNYLPLRSSYDFVRKWARLQTKVFSLRPRALPFTKGRWKSHKEQNTKVSELESNKPETDKERLWITEIYEIQTYVSLEMCSD